ncbi:hypothetical protein HNO89_002046 [Sporosarcina luteola]|nr:hypothetical protein [Sporosarcina luteola]
MESTTLEPRELTEKRIGLPLLVHGLALLAAAAFPEGAFRFWFPITATLEALLLLNLLRLWRKYKHQPKHYYTIHMYWLLAGIFLFVSISIIRMFYGTPSFYLVLAFVAGVALYAQFNRENMLLVLVDPAERKRFARLPLILKLIIIVGILLIAYMRAQFANPDAGTIIFVYFVSVFLLFIGAPLSIPVERIEEIKERVNQ